MIVASFATFLRRLLLGDGLGEMPAMVPVCDNAFCLCFFSFTCSLRLALRYSDFCFLVAVVASVMVVRQVEAVSSSELSSRDRTGPGNGSRTRGGKFAMMHQIRDEIYSNNIELSDKFDRQRSLVLG